MKNKIGLKSIESLELDKNVLEKLDNKTSNIYELCLCNRSNLKDYGLDQNEINYVVI